MRKTCLFPIIAMAVGVFLAPAEANANAAGVRSEFVLEPVFIESIRQTPIKMSHRLNVRFYHLPEDCMVLSEEREVVIFEYRDPRRTRAQVGGRELHPVYRGEREVVNGVEYLVEIVERDVEVYLWGGTMFGYGHEVDPTPTGLDAYFYKDEVSELGRVVSRQELQPGSQGYSRATSMPGTFPGLAPMTPMRSVNAVLRFAEPGPSEEVEVNADGTITVTNRDQITIIERTDAKEFPFRLLKAYTQGDAPGLEPFVVEYGNHTDFMGLHLPTEHRWVTRYENGTRPVTDLRMASIRYEALTPEEFERQRARYRSMEGWRELGSVPRNFSIISDSQSE